MVEYALELVDETSRKVRWFIDDLSSSLRSLMGLEIEAETSFDIVDIDWRYEVYHKFE